MKFVLVNYNFTPTWVKDYTDDYLIYDRSESKEWLKDFDQGKIIYTENKGNVDYDKLSYLVDNYDKLPDVFYWGKSNLFKYITKEEFDAIYPTTKFTPLLTQNHRTYSDKYGQVNYYSAGMYHERNDSWFLTQHYAKYFRTFDDWCHEFHLPSPAFIPFPPGGNFILTKERVHNYGVDTYDKMRRLMDYTVLPGEAQCAERTYFMLWK